MSDDSSVQPEEYFFVLLFIQGADMYGATVKLSGEVNGVIQFSRPLLKQTDSANGQQMPGAENAMAPEARRLLSCAAGTPQKAVPTETTSIISKRRQAAPLPG